MKVNALGLASAIIAVLMIGVCICNGEDLSRLTHGWQVSPTNEKTPGQAGYCIIHPKTGIELVYVPGGKFSMGKEGWPNDRGPVHEVQLSGFWIGRTEITVGQWRKVVGKVTQKDEDGQNCNSQGDNYPVACVTWFESQQFCRKLGLRLPTEAEWEYAARGSSGRSYPWGNSWDVNN